MSEFKGRLKKMQGNWETGKEKASEFGDLPDAQYRMQLQDAEIVESMNSGKLQIHCEHLVLDGEHSGEVHHEYLQLETEWGPTFVAQFIEKMGFEAPDSIEEVEEVIAEIAEAAPTYLAQLKTKGEFQNLRIKKIVEGTGEKPEKKEAEAEALEWEEDERCVVDIDGADFAGTVVSIKGKKAKVKFDDGDEDTYPLVDLKEPDENDEGETSEEEDEDEAEDEAESSDAFSRAEVMAMKPDEIRELAKSYELDVKLGKAITTKKRELVCEELASADMLREDEDEAEDEAEDEGDSGEGAPVAVGGRIKTTIDGTEYEGEVTSVDLEEEEVSVTFDDGDEQDVSFDDLTVLEVNKDSKASKKKSKSKSKGKKKKVSEEDLIALCQAQDIEVDDDDDLASLKKKILEYEWAKKDLTKEEIALLESIDATFE